jgi:hypothetical protein
MAGNAVSEVAERPVPARHRVTGVSCSAPKLKSSVVVMKTGNDVSRLGLLRHLKRVVDVDPKWRHRRRDSLVAEQ